MTAPFLDPIIYPGAPIENAIGKWNRLKGFNDCAIGGEEMPPGTIARWSGFGWECRAHTEFDRRERVPHPPGQVVIDGPDDMPGAAA